MHYYKTHRSNTSNAEPTVAVFMIIVAVVMLKVLIATTSDSFAQLSAIRILNWQLPKTQLMLSRYAKLSDDGRERLNLCLKHNPYVQVLTPTVVPQDADTEEWDGKVKGAVPGVTAAVKADIASMQSSSSNVSKTAMHCTG
jgi:hypothetical protein